MTREEINDFETDEEVSNRIKDCENDLWTCDESIKNAIYENVSVEVLEFLREARNSNDKLEKSGKLLKAIKVLFEDVEAYLSATAVELETGLLPDGE